MKKLKYANLNDPRTEEERQEIITNASFHYGQYMDALGIDWRNDPNSNDTPMRVAKAFVNDLAEGCYIEPPKITTFNNINKYDEFKSIYLNNYFVKITIHHRNFLLMNFP